MDRDSLPNERALGVYWYVEHDSLGFKVCLRNSQPTRRGILSVVSSVFDPIGLVSPFVLVAKQLLQTLCKDDIGWDDHIDDKTLKDLKEFKNIIYISCGFDSFIRDLAELRKTHLVVKTAMFDQFPYTEHIESGAILSRIAPN